MLATERELVMKGACASACADEAVVRHRIIDVRIRSVVLGQHHRLDLPPHWSERKRVTPTSCARPAPRRARRSAPTLTDQREVIVAEAYRDAQKVKGEGDAKASALYAEAFGRDAQFASFTAA